MEDLEPGLIIDDRYEVRRLLGRGGMSAIYEVAHRYTTRRLALKVLNADYASHAIARRQLLDEARALGAVRHPYVIEVHDAGFDGSRVYVVTELLEGRSLDGLLTARGRLAWPEVARVARHITIALAASHGVGVLHRDVKPSNVMIVRGVQGEFSKLLDFGVAALPRTAAEAAAAPDMLVGTPEYMSPEQLRGDPIDARTDLYALGITMFECLQGEVPMPGGLDVAHQRASAPALPSVAVVCDDVPRALADIVDRLLHPVAAFRFPSARSLLDALDASGLCRTPTRFLDDPPPEAIGGRATAPDQRAQGTGGTAARRRSVRAPYQTPMRVMAVGGMVIDGRSEDISAGGVLVIAGEALAEGERVVVRFALPTSGNLVQCAAVVNWVRHRGATQRGRAAFGLEFVDAPEAMTEAIAQYTELMAREG